MFNGPTTDFQSMPLFEHEMTQNEPTFDLKTSSQSDFSIIQDTFRETGTFLPLLTAASDMFGFTPPLTPQNPDFWGDQSPIYIPILRERLTNLQYQDLESFKSIFLDFLN